MTLRLHDQGLETLPSDLNTDLTSLQCPGNRLRTLPPELGRLLGLADLNLSNNCISILDGATLAALGSLKALTLNSNRLETVPAELEHLSCLQLLNLGANRLQALPPQLGACAALRTLTLSENYLSALPAEMGKLEALRTLRLDKNPSLTRLPNELCRLAKLEALSAAACGLRELPGALGDLQALSTFQAKDNRLASLPISVGRLQRLRTLALEGNRIAGLPVELGDCASLRLLSLSVNRLRQLPPLASLTALQELRIDDNPLVGLPAALPPKLKLLGLSVCAGVTALPDALGQLSALEHISIGAARIQRLPDCLFETPAGVPSGLAQALRILQLSGNTLVDLPTSLGRCYCLKTLEVSDNRLESLPETIGSLRQLETLRASENRLASVPTSICDLAGLKGLSLGANHLTTLPDRLGALSKLQHLEVHANRLSRLPDSIGELHALRRLLLDDNELIELPESLAQLAQLEELGLACNCLAALPTGLLTAPPSEAMTSEEVHISDPNASTRLSGRGVASEGCGLHLRRLRLHSNRLAVVPSMRIQSALEAPPSLFGNPCTQATTQAVAGSRPRVALLLPGLLRNYAHGRHWMRLVTALNAKYNVEVYLCLWSIVGSPSNNFAQSADKASAQLVDVEALAANYPAASGVELVGMEHWVDQDKEGFDGRYINQWNMVARCWDLMERSAGPGAYDYVIRARPDLRVACLPIELEQRSPYLAVQERLWGSDCFFYGDYESMRAVCEGLAPRYDEYTARLGQASSEPMMQAHLEACGLSEGMRFARCVSVDRT